MELKINYWNRSKYWKKYLAVNGIYALNVFIIVAITITLDSFGLVGYFDGDPEGSFGMLYFPSIFFYLLLGLIIGIFRSIWQYHLR